MYIFMYNEPEDIMKSKVLENKKEKQANLLQSAMDLFCANDIHTVTVSDIVKKAGVAKGTFYLYFKDKYQIRDILIKKESARLFKEAKDQLEKNDIQNFEDSIIFIINQVLMQLESNPIVLKFIERNLSWGVFNTHIQNVIETDDISLLTDFKTRAQESGYIMDKPEVVLFIIIETVGSTCYNSILYNQPLPIDEYKPYLFKSIRSILSEYKTK